MKRRMNAKLPIPGSGERSGHSRLLLCVWMHVGLEFRNFCLDWPWAGLRCGLDLVGTQLNV